MRSLLGLLIALFALCTVAAADDELWDNPVFVVGFFAAALACAGAMVGLGIDAAQIATCQP
jgi:small basic protein